MAARRWRKAIGFHVSICAGGLLLTLAVHCGTMPSLLHTVGFGWLLGVAYHLLSKPADDTRCLEVVCLVFHFCVRFLRSKEACAAFPRAAALVDATHTSREALRRGTAAVVKRSAGLECVSVGPLGSMVIPGSASLSSPKTA